MVEDEDGDILEGQIWVDFDVEVYYRGRADSVLCTARTPVWAQAITQFGKLGLMTSAEEFMAQVMDSRSTRHLVLRGSMGTRQFVLMDEIQQINILTPGEDTIKRAVRDAHNAIGSGDVD